MNPARLVLCLMVSVSLLEIASATPKAVRSASTDFSLEYLGETSAHKIVAAFVLPQEEVRYRVTTVRAADSFEIEAGAGSIVQTSAREWKWIAPGEPGLYPLRVRRSGTEDQMLVNAFVMIPFDRIQGERLNGYHIGSYPLLPWRGIPAYRRPKGFVEVTPKNADTLVSPNFRLRQFLCKQAGDFPKYVVLRERLLLMLELLLEHVNAKGIPADTLAVMSGYRTPYYNHSIGNGKYSRHVYGDAADVFVDVNPRDGVMDDLDGNGRFDEADAGLLYEWMEEVRAKPFYSRFVGGLARYKPTSSHGAFVHLDARGTRARWGT